MFWFQKSRARKQVLKILDQMDSHFTAGEVNEVRNLITSHNEIGAALELISTWLYEHQVELSKDEYNAIQSICERLDLPKSNWLPLETITRD